MKTQIINWKMNKSDKFNSLVFNKLIAFIFLIGITTSCMNDSLDLVEEINEDFSGITEIEIDGEFLEISYIGESGRQITTLEAQLRANNQRRFDIKYQVVGSKLKIELERRGGIGNARGEGSVVIRGPRNMKLDLEADSGSIRVENVVSSEIDLEVDSGIIIARNLTVNSMDFSATSGTINAQDLTGNLELEVNSGKATLERIDGNVSVELVSGEVVLGQINGLVNIENQSGKVEMNQVNRIGNAFVTSGQIFATNTGLATITSPRVTSGYIYIQTTSNLRNFNFNITTGVGTARVGTTSMSGSLVLNNGATATIRGEVGTGKLEIVN